MNRPSLGGAVPTGGDPRPAHPPITIIVVEDQPLGMAVVEEALGTLGVRVVTLGDITGGEITGGDITGGDITGGDITGGPASPGRFGAVTVLVTDVGPTGIPVGELLASFHAARPRGAVVFMTDLSHRRGALGAAGVNDVLLRKPFGAPDLLQAVARAIRNLGPKAPRPWHARTAA